MYKKRNKGIPRPGGSGRSGLATRLFSSPSSSPFLSFILQMASRVFSQAPKPVTSPIPMHLYPVLSALLLVVGLLVSAFFFIYEATTSTRNRSLSKELVTATVASGFLGFGSLFLLLATGVYV